jgi:hypothetical protein
MASAALSSSPRLFCTGADLPPGANPARAPSCAFTQRRIQHSGFCYDCHRAPLSAPTCRRPRRTTVMSEPVASPWRTTRWFPSLCAPRQRALTSKPEASPPATIKPTRQAKANIIVLTPSLRLSDLVFQVPCHRSSRSSVPGSGTLPSVPPQRPPEPLVHDGRTYPRWFGSWGTRRSLPEGAGRSPLPPSPTLRGSPPTSAEREAWHSPTVDRRLGQDSSASPSPPTRQRSRSPAAPRERHDGPSVGFAAGTFSASPPGDAIHRPWRAATPFIPCHDRAATTGFEAFAESEVPLGEGAFPLVEGFGERKLSAKASRRHCTSEAVFAESIQ